MSKEPSVVQGAFGKGLGKVQEMVGQAISDEELARRGKDKTKQSDIELKAAKGVDIELSGPPMNAIEWHGAEDMRLVERPRPKIREPTDIVLRVSSTTICGSDLHMYHNQLPGSAMLAGDVLGHEFMGFVEEVGDAVRNVKRGDRVVVSAIIACGTCRYCKEGRFSLCDTTNPSDAMAELYGHKIAAAFGYSHLTGGYQGGQAEYVRVPFADVNTLKVPDDMKDEQVLFLSDIVCTGWHANELAKVSKGDVVAVWGCGPVGLMAIQWAKVRGAARIVVVDNVDYRLRFAREKFGAETINFDTCNVVSTMQKMIPGGPDKCLECAGYRFPKSALHKLERTTRLETDALDIIDEMVKLCKKGGRISIIGDYFGYGNHFPIGAYMEKGQTMRGSQVFVQKYWNDLLGYIRRGEFDPTLVITHRMALEDIPKAYRMFANKEDNMIKVFIDLTRGQSASHS